MKIMKTVPEPEPARQLRLDSGQNGRSRFVVSTPVPGSTPKLQDTTMLLNQFYVLFHGAIVFLVLCTYWKVNSTVPRRWANIQPSTHIFGFKK
jgi:hypothetical protein